MVIKLADKKGRIVLGPRFADKMVLIDDSDPDRIVVTPAVAIPEREAWLYQNQEALDLVRKGLAEAQSGKFSDNPPDLNADSELAAESD